MVIVEFRKALALRSEIRRAGASASSWQTFLSADCPNLIDKGLYLGV